MRENAPLVYHGVDGIVTIIRRKMEQTEELRADLELPSILPSDNPLGDKISRERTANDPRGRRVRKANVLTLDACVCGITITKADMRSGREVMKCKTKGRETVWVRALPFRC